MASRSFLPPLGGLEVDIVDLFCDVTIGASGAVSSSSGKGIASVAKESSAGQYTITLSDDYNKLLWAGITLLHSSDDNPASDGCMFRILSETVATTKTIVIQAFAADDGADANPASGAVLKCMFKMRNSSVS